MDFNYAIVATDAGMVLHEADCNEASEAAAAGVSVMTMLGCERPIYDPAALGLVPHEECLTRMEGQR